MKKSRFSEEQIMGGVTGTRGGREGLGALPQARHVLSDLLCLEVQVWGHGGFRRQTPEGSGGEEHSAQEALCRCHAGQRRPEGSSGKNVWPAPLPGAVLSLI